MRSRAIAESSTRIQHLQGALTFHPSLLPRNAGVWADDWVANRGQEIEAPLSWGSGRSKSQERDLGTRQILFLAA